MKSKLYLVTNLCDKNCLSQYYLSLHLLVVQSFISARFVVGWDFSAEEGRTPGHLLTPMPAPDDKQKEMPPTSRREAGGLDQPVILGIVLGIMLLLLVVFITMCWWKQRQQKRRSEFFAILSGLYA